MPSLRNRRSPAPQGSSAISLVTCEELGDGKLAWSSRRATGDNRALKDSLESSLGEVCRLHISKNHPSWESHLSFPPEWIPPAGGSVAQAETLPAGLKFFRTVKSLLRRNDPCICTFAQATFELHLGNLFAAEAINFFFLPLGG